MIRQFRQVGLLRWAVVLLIFAVLGVSQAWGQVCDCDRLELRVSELERDQRHTGRVLGEVRGVQLTRTTQIATLTADIRDFTEELRRDVKDIQRTSMLVGGGTGMGGSAIGGGALYLLLARRRDDDDED